jgi:gluconolactonase
MRNRQFSTPLVPILALIAFLGIHQRGLAQASNFIAAGATPQPVSFDLGGGAAGGPSVDSEGNVYFTLTQLGAAKTGTIQKWTAADGRITKYRDVDGGAIGTAIDTKCRLLVGEWTAERITSDDMKGNITVLVDSIDGRKLLDPNAIVVAPNGGIYFSESGDAKTEDDPSGIDYISPNGKTGKQVAKLKGARKLILSPDGKTLIANGAGGIQWRFDTNSDGTLTNQNQFCAKQCANPVGFDENSNVYMVAEKLYIYSLKGEQLAVVDLPMRFSNAAFAGKDRKTLFLTGHDGVYTLQMAVKGGQAALDQIKARK